MSARGMAAERHIPVLRDRIVELLAPALEAPGAVYVDGTLGMGGHAEAILERCPQARLVGIDRDHEALALATERLAPYAARTSFVHAVYDEVPQVLAGLGLDRMDAGLFDLGVSSLQLDEAARGFSYSQDAPLDMRMDQSAGLTAAEVLNTYEAAELERVLREYGEERFARKIAGAIIRERADAPFTTSARLVDLLKRVVPGASQKSGGHPGKRTFQALRIEVNAELSVWARALPRAIDVLAVGGRVAVLSYHSLEDRITKRAFAEGSHSRAPEGLPVELPEHAAYLRLLTRGAEEASPQEQATNPRSASVRLRAAERTRLTPSTKGPHR
ncbi:16S rRNA (cytosine(1402)-N(4))-methyltransferase RsmH [Nostocoides sp. HKS02]|uniref:16S rRNA (cytosine(1402)-N(4))-methyltransferase RsmH n=1 Tax=Nostocoides sp. HKS02 TaxID=1813880 RepID=UPI0012B4C327|nr:16S rRNA (cytosine(1402)-N(4))-methyltransferase RsmH [Tetrasphaera sp. HKS02]QGN57635.1 16S rRNA (cytosine(1402)-N(4))-methyltransferase RsmH [Tetrasphaera sp. HKS02]